MTICPCCDTNNIDGDDTCELCGQPLSDLYFSDPTTLVERGLLVDRISSLDPRPPVVVKSNATVGTVLTQLVDASIGCVLVADGDANLVGIFTERDALRRLGVDAPKFMHRPVSDFMTRDPQCLLGDSKVAFAVHRMDVGGYRHVPILDEQGKTSGIISVRDILRFITEKLATSPSP
jgi:CBS domain-containing protein